MELKKEDIIKVLENNTVWFEALYEDLIHKGRFEAIADEIVKLTIPVVVCSKTKPKRKLGDFDVWYKPCTRCGYDTGKSTKPKDGNKTCWKCGNFVQRDFTDRALKK